MPRQTFLEEKVDQLRNATLVDVLSWVFPAVSASTTFIGVRKLTDNTFIAFAVAIVAFLLIAAFYRLYLAWYPTSNPKKRRALLMPMVFFAVLVICLTTPFSVDTFAGNVALRKGLEQSIMDAEQRTNDHVAALEREQLLAATLGTYGRQFTELATQESSGAFTGTSGHGDAAVTFETIGHTLGGMREQVQANRQTVEGLRVAARAKIAELRSITYESVSQQVKISRFAATLNDLSALLNRMDAASVLPAISRSAGSLNLVAQLRTGDAGTELGRRQEQTISKAQALVAAAQREIQTAAAQRPVQQTNAPLSVMDESEAIFVYWRSILWAFAAALALDFSPLLFLFILSTIGVRRTRKGGRQEEESTVTRLRTR